METPETILRHYPVDCDAEQVQSLGAAGGFSGAEFWKVLSPRGPLCLRKWPREHPNRTRIEFIHRLLAHVAKGGCKVVPVPLRLQSPSQTTYLQRDGHFWELTPWMPGEANYHNSPSVQKLQAAARTLASFHQLSADFKNTSPPLETAPTVVERLQQLDRWIYGDLDLLKKCLNRPCSPEMEENLRSGHVIVNHAKQRMERLKNELNSICTQRVPIQPCIRDIWSQHVLYCGDTVSGFVDFGAARPDTVVTDVVRLLGSLAVDDHGLWKSGLEAYEKVRSLRDQERLCIVPLDRSAVLLAGLNWLRWLFLEKRTFANQSEVEMRLKKIVHRLENNRIESQQSRTSGTFWV